MKQFIRKFFIKNNGAISSKSDFKILSNQFLIETEEIDKTLPPWQIKNHVPTLYSSLNEFYIWLDKNNKFKN